MAWRREGFDTRLTSIKGLSNTSEPEEVRQPTHPHSKPNMSQNTEAGRKCLFQGYRRLLTRLRYPW